MSNQEGCAPARSFQAVGDIQLGLGFEKPASTSVPPQVSSSKPVAAKKKAATKTIVLDGIPHEQTALKGLESKSYVVSIHSLKHPKVFPPPKSKNLGMPRELVLESSLDGQPIRSLTLLGNSITHCFTTSTLAVIAVLNEMWQEQGGGDDGVVVGTYAELVRRLGGDLDNESKERAKVKAELERLRRLVMIFKKADLADKLVTANEVTYLSEYDYVKDKANSRKNHFKVAISPYIVRAIAIGFIASLPIRALIEVKLHESRAILLRIDSLLAHNAKVVIKQTAFFDLLSVEPGHWVLSRKKYIVDMMQRVAADLDKRLMTNGCLLRTSFVEAGGELRIEFTKGSLVSSSSRGMEVINSDTVLIAQLKKSMLDAVGELDRAKVDMLYELYARMYPEDLIYRAIAVFQTDKPRTTALMSAGAFFSSVLCRIVRENGFAWVK